MSQLNRSDNIQNPALITEQVSPSNNGSLADTKQALNFSKLKPEGSPNYHDINALAATQFDTSPLKSMYLKGLNDLVQYQQRLQASGLSSAQIQDTQVTGFDRARQNNHAHQPEQQTQPHVQAQHMEEADGITSDVRSNDSIDDMLQSRQVELQQALASAELQRQLKAIAETLEE